MFPEQIVRDYLNDETSSQGSGGTGGTGIAPGGSVFTATVTFTADQLYNLPTDASDGGCLIVAGIEGQTIVPINVLARLNFGTVPFVADEDNGDLIIAFSPPFTLPFYTLPTDSSFLDSTTSADDFGIFAAEASSLTIGLGISLVYASASDPAVPISAGDGTLTITLTYTLA